MSEGLFEKLFGGAHGRRKGSVYSRIPACYPEAEEGDYPQPPHPFTKEEEIEAMDDLLGKLTASELPDAIDMIMLGPSATDDKQPGIGFARYAARLFAEVGASRIRSIAAANDLSVIRLSGTGMFWMRFAHADLSREELSCVLAAEAAMNRLLFMRQTFVERSKMRVWSEECCYEADTSWINSISLLALDATGGVASNPLQEVHSAMGRKGGEWDVRTRFALAVEKLVVPFRLSYDFDCNVAEGLFRVDYAIPLDSWMPQHGYDKEQRTWLDTSAESPQMAWRYAMSLGAVLSSVAFGTSVGIRRIRLVGHPCSLAEDATLSYYVDRLPFISEIVPRIETQDGAWLQAFEERAAASDPQFDRVLQENHRMVIDDDRPLPEVLRPLLLADEVRELDVLSDMPSDSWDKVHAAESDREEAPLAAIALLEDVAAQADAAVADLPDGVVPLYCSDAFSRFLVSLGDFDESVRFCRYSDSGFRARSILCDLYCEMGEPERGLQQAQACIELAPTSTIGYTDAVNALFAQQLYADAIPYLEKALSLASLEHVLAFVYYRLAYALWQTGRRESGLACYVLCSHHSFSRPEVVIQEMEELLSEMATIDGGLRPGIPNVAEAREMLQRDGIGVGPSPRVRQIASEALVAMVDAGILEPAAPLVRMIATTVPFRDELYAVASSLES